jgi:hypothetical protein
MIKDRSSVDDHRFDWNGDINYAFFIAYAKAQRLMHGVRCKVDDLIVLAKGNDPYYADSESGKRWADWFYEMWMKHCSHDSETVHLRGLHYRLASVYGTPDQEVMPDTKGTIYQNNEKCWNLLERAGKYARNNNVLSADKFQDRRQSSLVLAERKEEDVKFYVSVPSLDDSLSFPDFPNLPYYFLDLRNDQRYRIELWLEKSTQDENLLPLAKQYNVTMLSAQGELSITSIIKALKRAKEYGKPTRILYISDFDPAGKSMPVAASRKIEFWSKFYRPDVDIELYPVMLTWEQCQHYQLPRVPIKTTEKRASVFEAKYGEGATELDALEAFHRGELARIVEREILRYYDGTLAARTHAKERDLNRNLDNVADIIQAKRQKEIKELQATYKTVKGTFDQWYKSNFEPFQTQFERVWQGISDEMAEEAKSKVLDKSVLPEGKQVDTREEDCLYASGRSYMQQLPIYKSFAGKFSHLIQENDEDE